jgi:hypothetical protein
MTATAITEAPFIISKPYIRLGPTATGVEIQCAGTHLVAAPDQDENTIETFCGSYTSYKAAKWTITVTIAMSYGAAGAWGLIQPLCGTVVPFEIRPDIATASVDNPVMSGNCLVKLLPFIDADPGTASEVDLELKVQGDPVFGTTAPVIEEAGTEAASTEPPATV